MPDFLHPIHEESYGPWRFLFSVAREPGGEYSSHAVDMLLDDVVKGRHTVSRPATSDSEAIAMLRARAFEWLDDYQSRDHTGSTGFADL